MISKDTSPCLILYHQHHHHPPSNHLSSSPSSPSPSSFLPPSCPLPAPSPYDLRATTRDTINPLSFPCISPILANNTQRIYIYPKKFMRSLLAKSWINEPRGVDFIVSHEAFNEQPRHRLALNVLPQLHQ